jgi:hypothetical protein
MIGECRDDLVFTDQRGGVLRNSDWRAGVFPTSSSEVPACVRDLSGNHAA